MLKKNFLKLTRKSYRRKLIMFGAAIFMSLALTATGFAAWILSNDAKKDQNGSVEVGAVAETSIELSDITFDKTTDTQQEIKTFYFEPLATDNQGRVRYDNKNKPAPEDLDININFSLNNYQIVGDLYVEFKIPATIQAAIDAGYITLVGEYQKLGTEVIKVGEKDVTYQVYKYSIGSTISETGKTSDNIVSYTYAKTGDVEKIDVVMTLKFAWGAKFGATEGVAGQNPGIYFDTHEVGKNVEFATVKNELNTMKALMHGITPSDYISKSEEDQKILADANPMYNYHIVVTATVA